MSECVLCGATKKELKNKGEYNVREHKRKIKGGYTTVKAHKRSNPDRTTIEEHHISYFPEDTILVCTNCHNSIHNDEEFFDTEWRPPVGHSRMFYTNDKIQWDEEKGGLQYTNIDKKIFVGPTEEESTSIFVDSVERESSTNDETERNDKSLTKKERMSEKAKPTLGLKTPNNKLETEGGKKKCRDCILPLTHKDLRRKIKCIKNPDENFYGGEKLSTPNIDYFVFDFKKVNVTEKYYNCYDRAFENNYRLPKNRIDFTHNDKVVISQALVRENNIPKRHPGL